MEEEKPTFMGLLERSVIFQGALTLMVWGAVVFISVYQVITGGEVALPETLAVGAGAIVAYFFSNKDKVEQERITRRQADLIRAATDQTRTTIPPISGGNTDKIIKPND